MCVKSSSQVITPGVASGGTNAGHCEHFGKAPTSLHMSSQTLASLFCTCARRLRSAATHACLSLSVWSADAPAVLVHALSSLWPQLDKLSMWVKSSSQVITPGVASGGTNAGHCEHFGYAPTSLHMSSHTLASLFCTCARRFNSCVTQAAACTRAGLGLPS